MSRKLALVTCTLSFFFFVPNIATSVHRSESCDIIQLTDSNQDSDNPKVCGNGRGILFSSRGDLLNNGHAEQPDLFFADVSNIFQPVFYQLTNTTQSESGLSISDDCGEIAFDSRSNLTGGNLSNFDQLFYADISDPNNPMFTQLTNNGLNNKSSRGSISGDGTKIAVGSGVDITGDNPDLSNEYFIYDHNNIVVPFAQLTDTPVVGSISSGPVATFDGSRVAFITSQNFVPPGNNADGGRELYLSEISFDPPNSPDSMLYQITNFPSGDFRAQGAQFAAGGNYILISSNSNITGMNPDENPDFFLVDVTDPASPVFTQITDSDEFTAAFGIIDQTAAKMAFETNNPDFTPLGSDTSDQIIFADITNPDDPVIMPLTNFGNDADVDGLSSPNNFAYIAFESDSDLVTGNNTDESDEVFVLLVDDCLSPPSAIPTLSEWKLIALAGILGIIGMFAMRRRRIGA
ncbi:MAG: IPTL-CTERM sorting domain-containing protein [Pseudomonadota bacterium]